MNLEFSREEERFGSHFKLEQFLSIRKRGWDALHAISKQIGAGMTEGEAVILAADYLKSMGVEKHWHKINVRFEENTLKPFRDPQTPDTVLHSGDMYYIDIGPVFDDYEADVGKAFVVGSNEKLQKLVDASEEIFRLSQSAWKEKKLSGEALYTFMEEEAKKRGYRMIGRHMTGHRLADFPHATYYRGKLADQGYALSPYAWVLEVCLVDDSLKRAAFYEDLLF